MFIFIDWYELYLKYIAAAVAYGSLLKIINLPLIAFYYGRIVPSSITWVFIIFIFYFSKHIYEILIRQTLQGILPATTTATVSFT